MEAYTSFAKVYDEFMDNIPYEEWYEYILKLIKEYNNAPKLKITDLGCGTGTITMMLYADGYQMTGVDISEDMLSIATEKMHNAGIKNIMYTCQNMCEFELPNKQDILISVCDSMNYILWEEDMINTLKSAYNALDTDGIFIFDLKTKHYFRDVLGDNTFAENREDSAFIWENYYYDDEEINEYDLYLFIRQDEYFERFEENHSQRAYELCDLNDMIEECGFEICHCYEAFTKKEASEDNERVYYILKKKG